MNNVAYHFESDGLGNDQKFSVIDFHGFEGVSKLYEYHINLKSKSAEIDIDQLLQNSCSLSLQIGDQQRKIHGILSHFQQQHRVGEYTLYQAVLVPRMWQLSLYHVNEVYLDLDIKKIIQMVMEEAGLSSMDYEIKLTASYDSWPYRCQFGETHLQFISRLLEHLGIYYYFEQGPETEKVIFSDNKQTQQKMDHPAVHFTDFFGLDFNSQQRKVHAFVCHKKRLPKKIVLKDYNYEKPSVDVSGEAIVDEKGQGEVFLYGENFETPEAGKNLAKIRAEELLSEKEVFHAEGIVGYMEPGTLFEMKDHFRNSYNQDYLLLTIEHKGVHPSYLSERSDEEKVYYNSFTAIPADIQFRPPRITAKPKFYGTINALVDAEEDGKYAEMDEHGRYKVIMPFDRVKSRDPGKASYWLRMSQPFSGSSEGLCFPLRKGTEVLLTFINGDPDRPVISGAIPNSANPSMINSKNQTNNVIKTSSGNLIEMEDKEGSNRIKFSTPQNQTYMHLGAANAPGDGLVALTKGIHRLEVSGGQQTTILAKTVVGTNTYVQSSASASEQVYGTNLAKDLINESSLYKFKIKDADGKGTQDMTAANEISGDYIISRISGPQYTWKNGNEYNFGGGKVFNYGNGYEVNHKSETGDTKELIDTMKGFNITGVTEFDGTAVAQETYANKWQAILDAGKVSVSELDTFNMQNGNFYDFGCSATYNFGGGGYEESNKTTTDTKVNRSDLTKDKTANGGPFHGGISGNSISFGASDEVSIEKTIGGNKYEYSTDTKSIAVENNTEEESFSYGKKEYSRKYGGKTEECEYNTLGVIAKKTVTADGKEEVWKSDPNTGASVSYEMNETANGHFANFSSYVGFKQEIAIYLSQATNIKIFSSATIDIEIAATAQAEIKVGAAIGGSIDARVGGTWKLNTQSLKFEFESIGITAAKEAAATVAAGGVANIEQASAKIQSLMAAINDHKAKIDSAAIMVSGAAITLQGV